jgi:hypothetical protein
MCLPRSPLSDWQEHVGTGIGVAPPLRITLRTPRPTPPPTPSPANALAMTRIAIIIALAVLAATAAHAQPLPIPKPPVATGIFAQSQQSLPQIVQDAIQESQKRCEPERSALKTGFVLEKDINGDGRKDYILDYSKFQCGESFSFCGSAGCSMQVFASLKDGTYKNVWDDNVRDVQFARVKGRPAMILLLHGSVCGRVGAARCGLTLFWNGHEFNAAN